MELYSSSEQHDSSSKKITIQEHQDAITQLNIHDISKHQELLVLLNTRAISPEEFFEKLTERNIQFYDKISHITQSR